MNAVHESRIGARGTRGVAPSTVVPPIGREELVSWSVGVIIVEGWRETYSEKRRGAKGGYCSEIFFR